MERKQDLIDRQALLEQIRIAANRSMLGATAIEKVNTVEVIQLINEMQAEQHLRVVVLCRNCTYYIDGVCNNMCSPFVHDYRQTCTEPDDYCSYGRKRDI